MPFAHEQPALDLQPAYATTLPIKESSDELNPEIVVPDGIATSPQAAQSFTDYFALAVATCGVGYLPIAPGTWGSLVGVALFLGIRALVLDMQTLFRSQDLNPRNPQSIFVAVELVTILIVTLVGIWAASRTEKLSGRKDPGKVVVDEVSGQLIALLPIPLLFVWPWKVWVIVSFILFRFFDIVKPYPARKLEGLHAGLGIMADDVVAGAYAAVVVSVLIVGVEMFFL